jgi:hypothetical protein
MSAREAQDRIAAGPRPLPPEHRFNERWLHRLLAFDPSERLGGARIAITE